MCTLSHHDSEPKVNTADSILTDTITDIIDDSSDNGQSDDGMTGLDLKDNQQALQQESMTELATVVPITIQEDFLQDLGDNASKHTFSTTFMMA